VRGSGDRAVIGNIEVPEDLTKNTNLRRSTKNRVFGPTVHYSNEAKLMKTHLNPILKFWIEVERESRRKWLPETKETAITQILSEWEVEGNAMRYVGQSGRISWKATPRFLDHLRDAKLDAIEEFEDL
jgi:hypothetical protein